MASTLEHIQLAHRTALQLAANGPERPWRSVQVLARRLEIDDPETLRAMVRAGREGEWFETDGPKKVRLTELGWKVFNYRTRGRRRGSENRSQLRRIAGHRPSRR